MKIMAKKAVKKSRKKQKKNLLVLLKESWFWRIYCALLLLCAVALVIGLSTLSGVMAEYEQTRPIHTAEQTLATLNGRSWQEIYALDESARVLTQETPEQYAQYMEELTAGHEFSLKNILSLNEDEARYNVMMNGQKFAEITLAHSGEKTKHGFDHWQLKTLATTAMAADQYTITAPADSTVMINGKALTEASIIQRDIPTEAAGNLPDGVMAPTMVKYGVSMSFGAPENITATDKNGNAQQAVQDDEKSWSFPLAMDDAAIKAQVEEAVIKWGRRLAAYTTDDYSKSDLSNACINPSPARTYIRNMENQWAASHSGVDFENIKTYDYYVYSDSCFSCRISFDYIVHYKAQDKTYPTLYTMYFAKDGGSFKLYSFTMN